MTSHDGDRPYLALFVRLIGAAGFAVMAALIKLAFERGVHLAEIVFWRQATTVPIMLCWALAAGGLGTLRTNRPGAHAMRGLYGIAGMAFNFGAVILLPLAEAATFNMSAPIWAVMLSVVLLREKVGVWRCLAVAAGFMGIVVIMQPGGGHIPLFGAVVALVGAFLVALISIQIRDLSRTEKPVAIVFWFSLISVLCTAPFMPFVMADPSPADWLLLLGIGLTGTMAQLMVTLALRYGQVSSVIVMDYSSIIWATLIGWLVFANMPPATTWLGAPLVVTAGLTIAWRERTLARNRLEALARASGT